MWLIETVTRRGKELLAGGLHNPDGSLVFKRLLKTVLLCYSTVHKLFFFKKAFLLWVQEFVVQWKRKTTEWKVAKHSKDYNSQLIENPCIMDKEQHKDRLS